MEITVNIPDEVVAAAEARGLTPESYVEGLIGEKRVTAKQPKTREQRVAEMESFLEVISRNSEKIPVLPDEAFTRESFYSDHD